MARAILIFIPFAAIIFAYGIMAFAYMLPMIFGQAEEPGLWDKFFANVTSNQFAIGPDSFYALSYLRYFSETKYAMFSHTVGGGLASFLMGAQIFLADSKLWKVHRWTGYAALTFQFLNLVGSAYHLVIRGAKGLDVYSGKPFYLVLWALWLVSVTTGIGTLGFALKRDLRRHQSFARLNFGTMIAAPILRIVWVCFFWFIPSLRGSQDYINKPSTVFTLILDVLAMWAWQSSTTKDTPLDLEQKSLKVINLLVMGATVGSVAATIPFFDEWGALVIVSYSLMAASTVFYLFLASLGNPPKFATLPSVATFIFLVVSVTFEISKGTMTSLSISSRSFLICSAFNQIVTMIVLTLFNTNARVSYEWSLFSIANLLSISFWALIWKIFLNVSTFTPSDAEDSGSLLALFPLVIHYLAINFLPNGKARAEIN